MSAIEIDCGSLAVTGEEVRDMLQAAGAQVSSFKYHKPPNVWRAVVTGESDLEWIEDVLNSAFCRPPGERKVSVRCQ